MAIGILLVAASIAQVRLVCKQREVEAVERLRTLPDSFLGQVPQDARLYPRPLPTHRVKGPGTVAPPVIARPVGPRQSPLVRQRRDCFAGCFAAARNEARNDGGGRGEVPCSTASRGGSRGFGRLRRSRSRDTRDSGVRSTGEAPLSTAFRPPPFPSWLKHGILGV